MVKIEGKRVILTGASSGIGKATAFALARKGARLVLASRQLEQLEKLAEEIRDNFPEVKSLVPIACDVTNPDQVKKVVSVCKEYYGGVDILINMAGSGVYGPMDKIALEDFRSQMEVNFLGPVHFMLEVLPLMKKAGQGLIVNVSSLAAKHGVPYLAAYGASKAALANLGQSLHSELVRWGISVLTVYPNYTETDFFKKEKKVGGARRPAGAYASPQKVAEAIVSAIEKEKRELLLTFEGKALVLCQSFLPWLVRWTMERMALRLREKEELSYG